MPAPTDKTLQQHIEQKNFLRVQRHTDDPEFPITGFLIGFSESLLLLQRDNEFRLNGFTVLLRSEIETITCGAAEKMVRRIFEGEGLLGDGFGLREPLPLDSWSNLFRELRRRDYHVQVGCEDSDPDFFIGPLTQVSLRSVAIQYYDAAGALMEQSTLIPFDAVTMVTFGDHYTTTFRKYLKAPRKR